MNLARKSLDWRRQGPDRPFLRMRIDRKAIKSAFEIKATADTNDINE